jgi:putative ABC transport system permease protein
MDTLLQDLRYTLRSLLRNPGFTLAAVMTLALGIGATAAIFSAVNAVLLRPLPYPEPDRLAMVWLTNPEFDRDVTSHPIFLEWGQASGIEAIAGYTGTAGTFTDEGDPEEVTGARVTADFFRVLRTAPHLGSPIDEAHTSAGGYQVVVLSHRLWTRRFGEDPGVLGRTVMIDGVPREVIAVMPQGFSYPEGAEYWLPISPAEDGWQGLLESAGSLWLSVIGRLRPEAAPSQVTAELVAITERIAGETGQEGFSAFVEPLRDTIVGDVRPPLLILFGAVGLVLLIACANVANLLLARGATRGRELAVRTALGASSGRLTRQVLTESLVLAVIGGVAGLLVAVWGASLLGSMVPPDLPRIGGLGVDATVLGFSALLSLATGLLFGVAPAMQARVVGIASALRDAGRGASGLRMSRLRPLIVVLQVAIALLLLVGTGLLLRSFANLQAVEPGFQTERMLGFRLTPPQARYAEMPHVQQFYDELVEQLNRVPSVESASAINTLLLARLPNMSPVSIEGRPPASESEGMVSVTSDFVHPDFFRTMGMEIVRGRGFEPSDNLDALPVVVVNEAFVRRFLPEEDPIGRRFTRGNPEDPEAFWVTIVGVVADSRRSGLTEPVRPAGFRPTSQGTPRSMEVVVRTAGQPLAFVPELRRIMRELDPQMPIVQLRTVEQAMAETVATRRFVMLLLAVFAGLAVTLAAVGIYGVLSFLVGQRTREFGVRMALGAEPLAVLGLVLRQAMGHVLLGVLLGAAGALALTRLLASQLYGVSPTDPLTFVGVTALLVGVALLAAYLPARRAARVDPMIALRAE